MKFLIFLLTLIISLNSLSQNCSTISDGTYGNSQTSPYSPAYGLYDYGRSATIYYAADIGGSKTITSIQWYVDEFQSGYSQSGPYTFSNIKIYFGYTTLSGWSNINNVSGVDMISGVNAAQGITSWTKVFDGSVTFDASNVWKSITLDTPFSYNGTSNLIVQVENWDGSWAFGYPYFHYTSTSASSLRTVKYHYADGSMPATSTDATRSYSRPDIQFCEAVALPIELLSFNVKDVNDIVEIKWLVATQFNNDHYSIWRSIDGENWHEIIRIIGDGTSVNIKEYRYEDLDPYTGISYYRLSQTDYDGKSEYFNIASVYIKPGEFEVIKEYNLLGQEVNDDYIGITIQMSTSGKIIKIYKNGRN